MVRNHHPLTPGESFEALDRCSSTLDQSLSAGKVVDPVIIGEKAFIGDYCVVLPGGCALIFLLLMCILASSSKDLQPGIPICLIVAVFG